MKIRMIAVDMDGTFLDQNSKYDKERFLKAYQRMKANNIIFVIASGNPLKQLKEKFPEISEELVYISENGAYIVEGSELLFLEHIDQKNAKSVITYLKDHPEILCWVCTQNQSYTLDSLSEDYFNMFIPYFPGVKRIKDFSMINEPILKFALYIPNKNVKECIVDFQKKTDESVHIVDSGHYCVDIIPSCVNKGIGITRLMEKFQLKRDEIMAFGDAYNDYEMLKTVKYGYIMENASDDIKRHFHYIAPSNDQNGVLQVIENYLDKGSFLNLK